MDLTDPALWIALLVGALGYVVYVKLQPTPPPAPECHDCHLRMERKEEIVNPDNPEARFIPGEREAYFECPRCQQRARGRY